MVLFGTECHQIRITVEVPEINGQVYTSIDIVRVFSSLGVTLVGLCRLQCFTAVRGRR